MEDKLKILYVSHYKEPKSIKEAIEEKFKNYNGEVIQYKWKLEGSTPDIVFAELSDFVYKNEPDIIIGNSISGYFVAGINSIPKILINPALHNDQLIKIFRGKYKEFDFYNSNLWNDLGPKNRKPVFLCSSEEDELFRTISYTLVNKLYSNTVNIEKTILKNCTNELSNDELNKVLYEAIKFIASKDYKILNKINNPYLVIRDLKSSSV